MKKDMTCIVCPIGCQMTIEEKIDGTYEVSGNTCKRGPKYAINEMTNPTRVIPTTVVIHNAMLPRLPVKTAQPIPKGQIFDAMAVINQVVVEAPIKTGDIVLKNLLGLGIDVVATRTMDKC
ncbi:MAG: DUF1667 domain-containing protein [Acetobacterium sp.]